MNYKLRSLRLEDNKKQRELAKYLNISRQYYSEYELGKRKMPAEAIIKLAKYYNTTTDYVLGLEEKGVQFIMNKKGVSLIELLAVIVIIAIIVAIAVPNVFRIMNKGKKQAFVETVRQVYKAGERYRLVQLRERKETCVYFDFSKDYKEETLVSNKMYIPLEKLDLDGEIPNQGEMEVCKNYVSLTVSDGNTTVDIDKDKNETILDGDSEDNKISRPVIEQFDYTNSKNSITVLIKATDSLNKIVKYHYYLGDKLVESLDSNTYTFNDLKQNTTYKIKVVVENEKGFKTTASKNIKILDWLPSIDDKGKYVAYTPDNATWDPERDGVSETLDLVQGHFNIMNVTSGFGSSATGISVAGQSKNNSITCLDSSYVNKYSGWVIMDVAKDGTMTLLHAGTPECYYHDSRGDAAQSESILATASTASSLGTGKAWIKYGNANLAESVHYMNGTDFNTAVGNDSAYTSTCYITSSSVCQNNSFVDIGSSYLMASQRSSSSLFFWYAGSRHVFAGGNSLGVRPVIILKPGIKIGKTGSGTMEDPYQLTN